PLAESRSRSGTHPGCEVIGRTPHPGYKRDETVRLSSTVVVFAIFGLVFLVIVGERVASSLKPATLPPRPLWAPDFNPNDPAPDFELPDAKGTTHRLKDLTQGATFVGF